MSEKVTKMLIKVDLQSSRCCKKIKEIFCKYSRQIRDQIYDEKKNTVLITVVSRSPEKFRQKIICEGGETVQSVEILPDKDTKKPKKVTKMLIKVDLQSSRCCKKIKEIFCKYSRQIRDQIYDEKKNTVLITVVNRSPEKFRQKIICEGGETVQSVEILPDKDTKKPKKVRFIEPRKETAKPPASVRVPAPRKAPKHAPPKALQQESALPPLKAPKTVVGYPPVLGYLVARRRPVMVVVMYVGDQTNRV